MTLQYQNLLLLKSPQNNVASNIVITEKNKASQSYKYQRWALWDKVTDFTVEPVVQCDVLAVKNTSLDDDNDDCK